MWRSGRATGCAELHAALATPLRRCAPTAGPDLSIQVTQQLAREHLALRKPGRERPLDRSTVQQPFVDQHAVEKNLAQPVEVAPNELLVEIAGPILPEPIQNRRSDVAAERAPRETAIVPTGEEHVGWNSQHQLDQRLGVDGRDDFRRSDTRVRLPRVEIGCAEEHAQLADRLPRRMPQPRQPRMCRWSGLTLAHHVLGEERARLAIQCDETRERPPGQPHLQRALERVPRRLAQYRCRLCSQAHDRRSRPMPAQVRCGHLTDAEAAECAIATISSECRSGALSRHQALFVRGRNEAHQRAEGLGRRRHLLNRGKVNAGRCRFQLDVLTGGMLSRKARPTSRIQWTVGGVLGVRQHTRATRRALHAAQDDRRVQAARETKQGAFVACGESRRAREQRTPQRRGRHRWIVKRLVRTNEIDGIPEKPAPDHRRLNARREFDTLAAPNLRDFVERVPLLSHVPGVRSALEEAAIDRKPQ